MKRSLVIFLLILFGASCAQAALREKEIDYRAGATQLKGYLAWDDASTVRRPGILVVHEWWGVNDYVRNRARMLAGLGYVAMAVDMYGEGRQAGNPQEAGKLAGEIRSNLPLARERFQAALDRLRQEATVDPGRIAAIGYCFGGGVVLDMARAGVDLKGVVSFHGRLATDHPARKGDVQASVLVLNGDADGFVAPDEIAAFRKEMENAGATWKLVGYPEALHSFTNPDADRTGKEFNLKIGYNAAADKASWLEMQRFLETVFRPSKGAGEGKTPGENRG